jgi:hypothetical protein
MRKTDRRTWGSKQSLFAILRTRVINNDKAAPTALSTSAEWHWTEQTLILTAVCLVTGTCSHSNHKFTVGCITLNMSWRASRLPFKKAVSQLHRPQRWSFRERQTHEAKTQKFLGLLAKQMWKLSMSSVIVCLSTHTATQNRPTPNAWIFVTFYFWNF